MEEKYYVVATNKKDNNRALLEECQNETVAKYMLEWHMMHIWLYADNIELTIERI